jgi:alpha-ketoglutarate-dependent taurine dioxygenase
VEDVVNRGERSFEARGAREADTRSREPELVAIRSPGPGEAAAVASPVSHAMALPHTAAAWAAALKAVWPELSRRFTESGALLFRGFPVESPRDMEHMVSLFGGQALDYVGGAVPRTRIQGSVFNSTELNRHYTIRIHNELSYQAKFPRVIAFCCAHPAAAGGETTLADCRKVLADIPPLVVARFRQRGVRYTRVFQDRRARRELVKRLVPTYFHMTWQDVFATTDRDAVGAHCNRLGMEHSWRDGRDLVVSNTLPVVVDHAGSGQEAWFSHLNLFYRSPRILGWPVYLSRQVIYRDRTEEPNQIAYGDGSAIPAEDAEAVFVAIEKNTVQVAWRRWDLLVVDNRFVGHGRMPFAGPRRVMVCMRD